ncbi:hypothetical protein BV898_02469 [Hypsibius exemplaris]|uniref:Uncharacterized protein n=1 Tax=Hypsibius exemplaris TaxID=2072580 RepID=A0A1W0X8S9_HYPEX|nr:hypothetical protein BV898_02469 [Hypsibius exemplaris]
MTLIREITGLSPNQFIHLAIAHSVIGVLSSALQTAVYICVVQYNGAVYLIAGNLVPPILSLGLFCAFTYFWTAFICVKLGNQLRVIAATRPSFQTVARFRKLSCANLVLSCLLLIVSSYLISVTAFWYHYQYPTVRSDSVAALIAAGKAAMVIHVLHLVVAIVEILLNGLGLLTTPKPPLRITLTYQPHGFVSDPLRRPINGSLLNGYSSAPSLRCMNGSTQTIGTLRTAQSTTSIVSDF